MELLLNEWMNGIIIIILVITKISTKMTVQFRTKRKQFKTKGKEDIQAIFLNSVIYPLSGRRNRTKIPLFHEELHDEIGLTTNASIIIFSAPQAGVQQLAGKARPRGAPDATGPQLTFKEKFQQNFRFFATSW